MGIPVGVLSYLGCFPGNAGLRPAAEAGETPTFPGRTNETDRPAIFPLSLSIEACISVDISGRIRQHFPPSTFGKEPDESGRLLNTRTTTGGGVATLAVVKRQDIIPFAVVM